MRKKIKKSTGLSVALLIYVTAMAAYFLPFNREIGTGEKWMTVGVAYLIVALLWWVLRKKEKLMNERYDNRQEPK